MLYDNTDEWEARQDAKRQTPAPSQPAEPRIIHSSSCAIWDVQRGMPKNCDCGLTLAVPQATAAELYTEAVREKEWIDREIAEPAARLSDAEIAEDGKRRVRR